MSTATVRLLLLSSLALIGFAGQAVAQELQPRQPRKVSREEAEEIRKGKNRKEEKKVAVPDTIPFYNGTYVGIDVYGLGANFLGSDFASSELQVGVNLKNRFIPTLEIGMGGTDTWSETGIHYRTKATPYFRIGADYNVMARKKEKNSYLYVGLRYGMSAFKYDVATLPVSDPIWGDNIGNSSLTDDFWKGNVPFDHPGMKATVQWMEIVLGVKVRIYKNFNMGWSIRMKYKLGASSGEYGDPWYVPGFGKYKSNTMGLTYSLIYRLPL